MYWTESIQWLEKLDSGDLMERSATFCMGMVIFKLLHVCPVLYILQTKLKKICHLQKPEFNTLIMAENSVLMLTLKKHLPRRPILSAVLCHLCSPLVTSQSKHGPHILLIKAWLSARSPQTRTMSTSRYGLEEACMRVQ